MIERTTVRLPGALLDRARRKAAAEGRTLTALITEGLEAVTAGSPPRRQVARMPGVSTAGRGLTTRLDLDAAIAELEEANDLAVMGRARTAD